MKTLKDILNDDKVDLFSDNLSVNFAKATVASLQEATKNIKDSELF